MFIDIHVHTRRRPCPPRIAGDKLTYASPEELLEAYDEVGIERAVVLPGVNPECTYGVQAVEDVIELSHLTNGRLIPFCNVDPRAMTNSDRAPFEWIFKYYRDLGCKGVGEICANLPMLDPRVLALFKGAEAAGLPVTFHLSPFVGHDYGLVVQQGMPELEEVLQRFPKLKFFGHSQTFWAEIGANPTANERMGYPKGSITEEGAVPRLMRKYENLYGDLSAGSGCNALTRDEDYAVKFLTEFQDRLFFGTDNCQPRGHMYCLKPLAEFLQKLRDSGKISDTVFQKIARENAIRVLGL